MCEANWRDGGLCFEALALFGLQRKKNRDIPVLWVPISFARLSKVPNAQAPDDEKRRLEWAFLKEDWSQSACVPEDGWGFVVRRLECRLVRVIDDSERGRGRGNRNLDLLLEIQVDEPANIKDLFWLVSRQRHREKSVISLVMSKHVICYPTDTLHSCNYSKGHSCQSKTVKPH